MVLENRLVYIGQEKDPVKLVVPKTGTHARGLFQQTRRDGGLRGRKERTFRDAYMTYENRPLARVGNR